LATAAHEYPVDKPAPNRAEQNPESWWQAVVIVTRRVLSHAGGRPVAAVSFSGQMHGAILLDETDEPSTRPSSGPINAAPPNVRPSSTLLARRSTPPLPAPCPPWAFWEPPCFG
jgi:hypothetical protein